MIELTTSAFILLSIFSTPVTADAKPADRVISAVETVIDDPAIVDGVALAAPAGDLKTVETEVRAYFKDTPILAEIAKCESEFKHIGTNGNIITGKVNRGDIGVMQINKYYHEDDAVKIGIDLKTLRGNMAFAKRLYEKFGTSPWQSSASCWEKSKAIAKK